MKHPIIQKHLDALNRAHDAMNEAADELDRIAQGMPVSCPVKKGDYCACTGACRTDEYHQIAAVAQALRVRAEEAYV